MKLYFHPFSQNARRALSVALHLGFKPETILVDLTKGAHKTPDYLAMNPNGMVPVLDDDGFVLNESTAIAIYLADKAKSDVLPSDPKEKAQVLSWMMWDLSHWNPACSSVVFERLFKPMFGGQADEKAIATGLERFARFAKVLDGKLEGKTFLMGDKVTLADFAVACPLTMAGPARLPVSDYPNVRRWFAHMDTVAGWKESAPPPMG
jgi:glutathione S-transferase